MTIESNPPVARSAQEIDQRARLESLGTIEEEVPEVVPSRGREHLLPLCWGDDARTPSA
jgi:hypothetical protein